MKNKAIGKLLSIVTSLCIAVTIVASCAACNPTPDDPDNKKYYSNANDPLILSTTEVDGVFNPFFATSATDHNIIGMTQLGMLGNNKDGGYTYGDEAAVITKDLEIKTTGAGENQRTEYLFVLKNNVKFSDGSPLTMKDVLFTLYTYLDPMYTGSSTIYSTDIVGLQEYRTGEQNEDEQKRFDERFQLEAIARIEALVMSVEEIKEEDETVLKDDVKLTEALKKKATGNTSRANVVADYEKAKALFKEEIDRDWSNSLNAYSSIKFTDSNNKDKLYENLFSTDVEAFLYYQGLLTWNRKDNKLESALVNDIKSLKTWTEKQAKDAVWNAHIPNDIAQIVQYYGTAAELTTFLANAAKTEYFAAHPSSFKNISGIKFANFGESVTVNDTSYAKPEYNDNGSVKSGNEVLSITIKKIDPKAIWNFSFGVAPMYYYSNVGATDNDGGKKPIAEYDYANDKFGVVSNNFNFMQNVVNDSSKIGVPVGAGPYKAVKATGGDAKPGDAGEFKKDNIIYFESNPHYLMGEPKIKKIRYATVSNTNMLNSLETNVIDFAEPEAKNENITAIDKKKSEGLAREQLMTNGYGYIGVNAGKIPSRYVRRAIMYSIDTAMTASYFGTMANPIYRPISLASWAYPRDSAGNPNATAYYPYIGGKVPENLNVVDPYYKNYVKNKGWSTGYTPTTGERNAFIESLITNDGFTKDAAGVYVKDGHKLSYTFTIAGEETDHPAYAAMLQASEILNQCGFDVTVATDSNALKKLASGSLTVWAAAWGSTIDPDMYQVYHKDSKAGSTLNWGYQQIKQNAGNKYEYELDLVNTLSELIEDGRATNEKEDVGGVDGRKTIYARALDIVMQLAVELPTYQRSDLFAYRASKIDETTFTAKDKRSPYKGLMSDIHLLSLIEKK